MLQFLEFFKETPPRHCRFHKEALTRCERSIKKALKEVARDVSLHHLKVKHKKEVRAISAELLERCRVLARPKIPLLLDEMEEDPWSVQLRYMFYGYLSAYLACIYGHRTGVMTNMTVEEVEEAEKSKKPNDPGYVINVAEHKTNKAFGFAQLFLVPDEFQWLKRWLHLRAMLKPDSDRVLITGQKSGCKDLVKYLQSAWGHMGLQGKPTFIDIRSAISTHAKTFHCPEVRTKLSAVMCHDTRTADK